MKLNKLAISAASLMLVCAFLACNRSSLGGETPTAEEAIPSDASPTPDPSIPTNTDGAETIVIPGGTFWMGSDESDAEADEDEMPRHQVTLETFPIYTHEVTNEMYARCVEAGACIPTQILEAGPTSHYDDPEFAEHPVVGVDWNMANDYCTWAGARLPTEAEWEYTARGADSLLYPWGSEEPACDRVNMLGCLVPPDTVKVGSYERGNSPFEVWDMSGNVWEWTHDWYDPDYYALSPSSSPVGPNYPDDLENPQKVVRSGGMNSEPPAMRSAARIGARPVRSYDDVGFRCVAQPALDLPVGYAGVPDVHEMVPPDPLDGGGESVEDPDGGWFVVVGPGAFTCPDAGGRIHLTIHVVTEIPDITFTVDVEGAPFDCSFDEGASQLECTGPVPAGFETWGDVRPYHVCYESSDASACHELNATVPAACPAEPVPPLESSVSASCPNDDGIVILTVTSTPEVMWDTFRRIDSGLDIHMPCWPMGGGEYGCYVLAEDPGHLYTIALHGFSADGIEYDLIRTVAMPDGCPVNFLEDDVVVTGVCSAGHQAVQVEYPPESLDLASVTNLGIPLSCITVAPGVEVCGELMGTPGLDATVAVCFADEGCTDWTVTVPDCPAEETEFSNTMLSICYAGVGPAVAIQYFPTDSPLVAANANGADLTCVAAALPGYYMCYTLPGAPGSTMTITFCLADGSCHSRDITVQDCTMEAEPFGDELSLGSFGCHSETDIFFVVNTTMEWLGGGTPWTATVSDGDTDYICSLHPTIPHALYCSGERPDTSGTLEVCIQQVGAPAPVCASFPGWPTTVDAIPACAAPPDESGDACAQWNINECSMHPPCTWQNGICQAP